MRSKFFKQYICKKKTKTNNKTEQTSLTLKSNGQFLQKKIKINETTILFVLKMSIVNSDNKICYSL